MTRAPLRSSQAYTAEAVSRGTLGDTGRSADGHVVGSEGERDREADGDRVEAGEDEAVPVAGEGLDEDEAVGELTAADMLTREAM